MGMALASQGGPPALDVMEDCHRFLLDHIGEGCLALDSEFHIVFANAALAAAADTSKDSLLGQPLLKALPNLAGSACYQACRLAWERRIPQDAEHALHGKIYHVRVTPMRAGLFVLFTDITAHRQLQEELLQSLLRSRLLLEQLPAIHWIVDRDLRITQCSGGALKNLGLKPADVKGKSLYEYFETTDSDYFPIRMHRAALDGEIASYSLAHGGRQFDCTLEPQRDQFGRVIGVAGLGQDVTDRFRAEEERGRIQEQFYQAKKLESIGLLASGIAHDFNNILVGILGGADLLARDLPADSPHRSLVEMIRNAGERAAQLTRQMLIFAGKSVPERRLVDLNRLVQDNLHLLDAGLSKRIEVVPRLAADLPYVQADPGQLQQVVMNLILNAAQAVEDGTSPVVVSTGVQDLPAQTAGLTLDRDLGPGRYVFLEVADKGCGMTPDVMARIFDPFFTTKTTGRGLGLSAVQGIIQAHNGAIHLSSSPGQGTVFRIFIPAGQGEQPEDARARQIVDCAQGLTLIIDDEPISRGVAAQTLTQAGVGVLVAAGGQEGVRAFQDHLDEIGLVLLDIVMPGMSGMETLAALRKLRPDIQVVLMSGYEEPTALEGCGNAESVGFLKKPYSVNALLKTVGRVLPAIRPL